jgi:hypothetical protein
MVGLRLKVDHGEAGLRQREDGRSVLRPQAGKAFAQVETLEY